MSKICIFGASGTFGTAFTEMLLKTTDWEIVGVSRNETKGFEWLQKFNNDPRIKYVVGDIRNYDTCYDALEGCDYSVVAAAIKHIDYAEQYPKECTRTNVIGVLNAVDASIARGVKKCVYMSTDKAANPTTIYGCSKLYAEMYVKAVDHKNTEIVTTRYGNVFGSNGSVAFIFDKLAKEGKPLTVTNPEMTRFFMKLETAVNLVWTALTEGKHGDLWVYNNKACTIKDLADVFSTNQVVKGLRCIEKNDEALLTTNELNHSEIVGDYFRVNKEIPLHENYSEPLTSNNAARLTREELIDMVENWRKSVK